MTDIPPIWGTVARWITALSGTGIFAVLAYVYIWRGRIAVDAARVVNEDEADIRDHYADEVSQLRHRLDQQSCRHRRVLAVTDGRAKRAARIAEERHAECLREQDALRDQGRKLKDIVAGLIRIIAQASASKAILLDSSQSRYVTDAAERIDLIYAPQPEEPPK